MFGVVPKPLWERRIPADERNRILLGMRCLLVEHERGLVLIDTGVGNKESEKFRAIYGIENEGLHGGTWLEDGIRALGFSPGDVQLVINTHLHFDHAGGNTRATPEGMIVPTFSSARYVIQRAELEYASRRNERTAASYFAHNWIALIEEQCIDFVDGDSEIIPGISVLRTPGHVPNHQSVLLDGGNDELALFVGDVCPTHAHLPLPWIMGYDVEPLVTLETKRRLMKRAVDEDWLLIFEHDATVPWGRAAHDGKGYALRAEDG